MKKIGIIAEYNPFHNGHMYQINKAKELANTEHVVVCMSGDFVQRGGPAIVDKSTRAEMAVRNGASLVIELPMPFSCQSAEDFAYAAIRELKKVKISHLSFGAETDDLDLLYDIAEKQLDKNSTYNMHLKKYLGQGLSYSNSCINAMIDSYDEEYSSRIAQVFKANNILAIEYIKACIKLDFNPNMVIVKRKGNDHNEVTNRQGEFSSAMSIRKTIFRGDDVSEKMPLLSYDLLERLGYKSNYMKLGKYFDDIKFIILQNEKKLDTIYGIEEGIENRIIDLIFKAENLDDFFDKVISKRYNKAKISRMLNNILLNISKEDMIRSKEEYSSYIKILAMNDYGREILSELRDDLIYISKFSDYKRNNIDVNKDIRFLLTNKAKNIYNLKYLKEFKLNSEYKEPSKYIK